MVEHAVANGLDVSSIDSVYLQGEEALREHERRNGYDLEYGPNGVMSAQQENTNDVVGSDVERIKERKREFTLPSRLST
jgi:hypothetical protein